MDILRHWPRRPFSHHHPVVARRSIFTSKLEVERKFIPSAKLLQHLASTDRNGEVSLPIQQTDRIGRSAGDANYPLIFCRLPDQTILDSYYDIDDKLSYEEVWVRFRATQYASQHKAGGIQHDDTSRWEAKVRLAGDRINSHFHEIEGKAAVQDFLKQRLGIATLEDLNCIADIKTHRATWVSQDAFVKGDAVVDRGHEPLPVGLRIVFDQSTAVGKDPDIDGVAFRHVVGELDITKKIEAGETEEEHEKSRREEAARIDGSLERLMRGFQDLFVTDPKPVGKLTAYFAWAKDPK